MECSRFSRGLCITQILSIAHKIYKYLDSGYDVRGTFLDNLKGFDKILHNGVFFNLGQNRICDNYCIILQDHRDKRKESVELNSQVFS